MTRHGVPHEAHENEDPWAKRVGLLAAILAILLAIVTISSHRSHTHGIIARAESNDQWSYYQSKRIKYHTVVLGIDLIGLQAPKTEVTEKLLEKYVREKEKEARDAESIRENAQEKDRESKAAEVRALRFDFAEGLIEIGLVMSSLYFLAHRKIFPAIGLLAGASGTVLGVVGFLS